MRHERWGEIEFLYHAARELSGKERAAYLSVACVDDNELHGELTSLLAESDQPNSFLSRPTLTLGFSLLDSEQWESISTEQFGPYRIIRQLGRGGMGVVYLAEDPRLERLVALKLLPTYLNRQSLNVLRFEQEARAASGVSHPNVAHIYEIGEVDEHRYIAMEYVDGESLRTILDRGSLVISETIEVVLQVANALSAAHSAGIVHRDIKPENIIVRHDGYVKVLDFGLAKLIEAADGRLPHPHSKSDLKSTPGIIMGTTPYMSPEQLRGGQAIDHRTDLWSLGVTLYEMVVGHRPFTGDTPSDISAAVLLKEPEPFTIVRLAAKEKLSLTRIVKKALQKDMRERYASAVEFVNDLKELQLSLTKYHRSSVPLSDVTTAPHPYPATQLFQKTSPDLGSLQETQHNWLEKNRIPKFWVFVFLVFAFFGIQFVVGMILSRLADYMGLFDVDYKPYRLLYFGLFFVARFLGGFVVGKAANNVKVVTSVKYSFVALAIFIAYVAMFLTERGLPYLGVWMLYELPNIVVSLLGARLGFRSPKPHESEHISSVKSP